MYTEVMDSLEPIAVFETSMGSIEIAVLSRCAPASAGAFLARVDEGTFTRHGCFYRAVRKDENDRGSPGIDVLQGGWLNSSAQIAPVLHEPTTLTGVRHVDGTVSLARGAVGTATGAAFFICIGDQPALDIGGGRDPFEDGQGFAAFGRVVKGMDLVRRIHRLPTNAVASDPYLNGQLLDPPVRILNAYRKSAADSRSSVDTRAEGGGTTSP